MSRKKADRAIQDERRKKENLDAVIAGTNLAKANDLFDHGDLTGARREYRAVLQSDPRNATAYYNLSLVAAQRGNREKAEAAIRTAPLPQMENSPAWNQLGIILLSSGKKMEAERASNRAAQ